MSVKPDTAMEMRAMPNETRTAWLLRIMRPLTTMSFQARGVPPTPADYARVSILAGFWPDGFDDGACKRNGGFTTDDVVRAETAIIERSLWQIATMAEGTS